MNSTTSTTTTIQITFSFFLSFFSEFPNLPTGTGTAATEAAAAETSTEAAARTVSAAETSDPRAATPAVVVVIAARTSGLPLHDETAFAATVSVFEQIIMIRLPDKVPRLQHQRESTTPGTTSGTVESDQHDAQRHEDDQKDDQENRPRRQIVRCPEIVVAAQIELTALKHRCHGTQPRHHTGAVISLPEIRQHVTHLDPLAKCIGQDAFQSRSGHEPHFPAIDDQENAQSVVRIGTADTPLGKSVWAKEKRSSPRISSTATTATWANARCLSE